jgi:hypothetical protein
MSAAAAAFAESGQAMPLNSRSKSSASPRPRPVSPGLGPFPCILGRDRLPDEAAGGMTSEAAGVHRGLGSSAAWPVVVRAQQRAMPVVGFFNSGSADAYAGYVAAFRKGLGETGYVEGQNVTVEYHWLEGRFDRLPALMADLVRRRNRLTKECLWRRRQALPRIQV